MDKYFSTCTFIKQWTESNGTTSDLKYGPVKQHISPFDLCLVSMNPTVIVGVEKKDPKASSLNSPYTKKYLFIGTTFLDDPIEVRTILPYHPSAEVVWFAPDFGDKLHQIDLGTGTASFAINKKEQITVTVEGSELKTIRKISAQPDATPTTVQTNR